MNDCIRRQVHDAYLRADQPPRRLPGSQASSIRGLSGSSRQSEGDIGVNERPVKFYPTNDSVISHSAPPGESDTHHYRQSSKYGWRPADPDDSRTINSPPSAKRAYRYTQVRAG